MEESLEGAKLLIAFLAKDNSFHVCRNWQYNDVYKKTIENWYHDFILETSYILNACNMHVKLASSTEQKNIFSLNQFCHCTLKS